MDIDSRTGLVLEGEGCVPSSPSECWTALWTMTFGSLIRSVCPAGASNGISYASRQRGRSRFSNIDLLEKYDYIGFRHFLRGRGYIDMKYLFYIYPENIIRSTTRRISSRRTASSWSPAIA